MNMKSVTIIALGLILAAGSTTFAGPFSDKVTNDLYNGNTVNGIPTPQGLGMGYDLFNAVNRVSGSTFTKNEQLDNGTSGPISSKFVANDAYWDMQGTTAKFFVLGYQAKNTNNLGFYTLNNNNQIVKNPSILATVGGPLVTEWLGSGSSADPFKVWNTISNPYTSVYWWMDSISWSNPNNIKNLYSQPNANQDLYDHTVTYLLEGLSGMKVYYLENGVSTEYTLSDEVYLVGWKDKWFDPTTGTLGDDNYSNIMVLYDSQQFIPVPDPNPGTVPEPATLTLVAAGLAGMWFYGRRSRR